MRTLLVVVAVAGCGGSSKPAAAPPPATTVAPPEKPEAVAVASDPEEGGQVASASPPPAAPAPGVASDPEEGGQVASADESQSSGAGIMAGSPGLGGIGTVGAGAGGGKKVSEQGEAPRVQPGEPKVTGDLDRSVIKRVVKAHFNQIRYCYEKSLQANPTLRGRVTVTFTIEKDGRVSAAQAEGIEDNLDRCIEGRFKTFAFPKAASPATIVYPFAFASD